MQRGDTMIARLIRILKVIGSMVVLRKTALNSFFGFLLIISLTIGGLMK